MVAAAPAPSVLQARLYPSNDVATQTGMVSGTVTNVGVTGASGYIGSALVDALQRTGVQVSRADRRDADCWTQLVDHPVIFHLAGNTSAV